MHLGSRVFLPSHEHPRYYPRNAYVLWTLHYTPGEDITDIVYQISFGYVRISLDDFLTIGYGWNPNNTSALITSYGHSYFGFPEDLFVPADDIFVEFKASHIHQAEGFELEITVRNISG